MIQPTAPPKYDSLSNTPNRGYMLNKISNEFEISNLYIEKMSALNDYDIVFVIDDSGSMKTPISNGTHSNRWEELKYITNIAIRLGVIFDDDGIDIRFLNRNGVNNVTSFEQIKSLFINEPYGRTPLTKVVREIFTQYQHNEKPILLVIATDGIPTNQSGYSDIHNFNTLITNKNHKFYISFLACSDQDDDIEYLNILDKKVPNVDTLDDYLSELKEVQNAQGLNYKYSLGDHVARLLLGPICPELDSLDEHKIAYKPRRCCIL